MNIPKLELSKREKEIIRLIADDIYDVNNSSSDYSVLEHLEYLGVIKGIKGEFGAYFDVELTSKSRAYLLENPKLKDPSIWEDKKFWIGLLSNLL